MLQQARASDNSSCTLVASVQGKDHPEKYINTYKLKEDRKNVD
jgi:hypothetical protein